MRERGDQTECFLISGKRFTFLMPSHKAILTTLIFIQLNPGCVGTIFPRNVAGRNERKEKCPAILWEIDRNE